RDHHDAGVRRSAPNGVARSWRGQLCAGGRHRLAVRRGHPVGAALRLRRGLYPRRARVKVKTRAGGGPTAGSSASNCVRIASYNIHLGIGRDGAFEPARIAAVIAETGADVVALQEISLGAPGFDMLHYLCEATGMAGVAGPTLVTARGEYGNAVLSRHPVTAAVRLDMSVPGREPRGALDVRADCNGRPLR